MPKMLHRGALQGAPLLADDDVTGQAEFIKLHAEIERCLMVSAWSCSRESSEACTGCSWCQLYTRRCAQLCSHVAMAAAWQTPFSELSAARQAVLHTNG